MATDNKMSNQIRHKLFTSTLTGYVVSGKADASLKKNTAFIKKLKMPFTAETLPVLEKEFGQLKLDSYLMEAVQALCEGRLRTSVEVYTAVHVCVMFHRRFSDFGASLQGVLYKILSESFGIPLLSADKDIRTNMLGRMKYLARFYFELLLTGVFAKTQDWDQLLKILSNALEGEGKHLYLPIAIHLTKILGDIFLDSASKREGEQTFELISPQLKAKFNELFTDYFKAMCRMLIRDHQELKKLENKGRSLYDRGNELGVSQTNLLKDKIALFETFHMQMKSFSEHVELPLPTFQQVEKPTMVEGRIVFSDPSFFSKRKEEQQQENLVFDCEDERAFYEDFVDLRERIPEILLSPTTTGQSAINPDDDEDISSIPDVDPESLLPSPTASATMNSKANKNGRSRSDPISPTDHIQEFFRKLSEMASAEMADKCAIQFCHINSKSVRERTVVYLVDLPKRRLELLPFIARFMRTIQPLHPEMCEDLSRNLVGQYMFLFRLKSAAVRGTRSRICRYIAELVKVGAMSQGRAYAVMKKTVLEDFTLHNVDMVALLLKQCGRFLFNQPTSHRRMTNLIEMLQKKKHGNLESYQRICIDNAIYLTNPPRNLPALKAKERPLELQFLYHQFRSLLNPKNAQDILQLCKIAPYPYLLKTFLSIHRIQYSNIHLVASMTASLSAVYPQFPVDVVDGIVEKIYFLSCQPLISEKNKLIACVKFIGELFVYGVIDSDVIYSLLNLLITLGHANWIPRISLPSPLDPPNSCFRIRLVCVLMDSCRSYLVDEHHDTLLKSNVASTPWTEFLTLFNYYLTTKDQLSNELKLTIEEAFDGHQMMKSNDIISQFPDCLQKLVALGGGKLDFLLEDVQITAQERNLFSEKMEKKLESSLGTTSPSNHLENESRRKGKEPDEFTLALHSMITSSIDDRNLEAKRVFDMAIPILKSKSSTQAANCSNENGKIKLMLKGKSKRIITRDLPDSAFTSDIKLMSSQRAENHAKEMAKLQSITLKNQ